MINPAQGEEEIDLNPLAILGEQSYNTTRELALQADPNELQTFQSDYFNQRLEYWRGEVAKNAPVQEAELLDLSGIDMGGYSDADSSEQFEQNLRSLYEVSQAGGRLTYDQFKLVSDNLERLREKYGSNSLFNRSVSEIWDSVQKAFSREVIEGGKEGLEDANWTQYGASVGEAALQETRALLGLFWHSTSIKDGPAWAVKSFLTGADTPQEQYAMYNAAVDFAEQSDKYDSGQENIIFDKGLTNPKLVTAARWFTDVASLAGLVASIPTGGTSAEVALGIKATGIAAKTARAVKTAARAVEVVSNAPIYALGGAAYGVGRATELAIGKSFNVTGRLISKVSGGVVTAEDATKAAIAARVPLTIGGFLLGGPASSRIAQLSGLGILAENAGSGMLAAARAPKGGLLNIGEQVAEDSITGRYARVLATGIGKVDNIVPVFGISYDGFRGAMAGAMFNAGLSYYNTGADGDAILESAFSGIISGGVGGAVGGTAYRLANLNGKIATHRQYEMLLNQVAKDSPDAARNMARYVAKHDNIGIDVRGYVVGVPRLLGATAKVHYVDGQTFQSVAGSQQSGAFLANKNNGLDMIYINVDATNADYAASFRAMQAINPAHKARLEKTAQALERSGGRTAPHELYHALISQFGYKTGYINRLASQLFGINVNGTQIVPSGVPKAQILGFAQQYRRDLLSSNPNDPRLQQYANNWYNNFISGINQWNSTGVMSEQLRQGVEEFGAYYFENWIAGKPMDYLFRGGDLGLVRNAFAAASQYVKDYIADVAGNNGYSFTATATSRGMEYASVDLGFMDVNGRRVRDKVIDKMMEDLVRGTWNPPVGSDVSSLVGESLRAYATHHGLERRIYKDKFGTWRWKSVREYNRAEYERGQAIFSALKKLTEQGIDIGTDIVNEDGKMSINGILSGAAVAALKNEGLISTQEALMMNALGDKVRLTLDKTSKLPNGVRFDYHGLTEQTEAAQDKDRRLRRPKDTINVKRRDVIPYRIDMVLTTKDREGMRDEPRFVMQMTGIDNEAVNRRIVKSLDIPMRLKNGTVTTVGQLLGGWALAKGKVYRYLENLADPNAKPSAALFGGGARGAAIRDAIYHIVGTVPSAGTVMANRPNASLPPNKRGGDFIFTSFRLDLMSNLEDSMVRFKFDEEVAYPRAVINFSPYKGIKKDEIVHSHENVEKKNIVLKVNNRPIYKNGQLQTVTHITTYKDGTVVKWAKGGGAYVFSKYNKGPVELNTIKKFWSEAEGKEVTITVEQQLRDLLDKYAQIDAGLEEGNDTIYTPSNIAGVRTRSPFTIANIKGRYFLFDGLRDENNVETPTLLSRNSYDNIDDAVKAAASINQTERIIRHANKHGVVLRSNKTSEISKDPAVLQFLASRLRAVSDINARNTDAIPISVTLSDGKPVIRKTTDSKTGVVSYDLAIRETPWGILEGVGFTKKALKGEYWNTPAYSEARVEVARLMVEEAKEAARNDEIKAGIDWYRKLRRQLVAMYGPAGNAFFEMLAANSPNEGPRQNWIYAKTAFEKYTRGEFDAFLEDAARKRDIIIRDVESGAYRKRFELERAVEVAKRNLGIPDIPTERLNKEVQEAIQIEAGRLMNILDNAKVEAVQMLMDKKKWDSKARKEAFERNMQAIRDGTIDVEDALHDALKITAKRHKVDGIFATRQMLIESVHDKLNAVITDKDPVTGKSLSDMFVFRVDSEGNAKRFGFHNHGIAQVLLGMYEMLNYGPKTYNYQLNLKGAGEMATVDVWAARTLRRLVYNKLNGQERWRIIPEAQRGVEDAGRFLLPRSNFDNDGKYDPTTGKHTPLMRFYKESNGDFFFGQDVFAEAAKMLREEGGVFSEIEPHDLQALMWFKEKVLWRNNKWTKGNGAELSSYEKYAKEMMGSERDWTQDSSLDNDDYRVFSKLRRIRIDTSSTPEARLATTDVGNIQSMGLPRELVDRIRSTYGKGLAIATMGTDATMQNVLVDLTLQTTDTYDLDKAFDDAIDLGIEIGRKSGEADIIVSERVVKSHPNARPSYTLVLNRPYEVTDRDIQTLMRVIGSQTNVTLEPNVVNIGGRPQVTGINLSWVPEFESTYRGAIFKNQSDINTARIQFQKNVENVLRTLRWNKAEAGEKNATNVDGSDRFTRIPNLDSNGAEVPLRIEGVDLTRLITQVDHHFLNSVVLNSAEFKNGRPQYMDRGGFPIQLNIRRHKNAYENAKQIAESHQSDTVEAAYQPQGDSEAEGVAGQGRYTDDPRGTQGSTEANDGQAGWEVKSPEQHIAEARRFITPTGTEVIEIGPDKEYRIDRKLAAKDGVIRKSDKWHVVRKGDSKPAIFNSEQDAIDHVRRRLQAQVSEIGRQAEETLGPQTISFSAGKFPMRDVDIWQPVRDGVDLVGRPMRYTPEQMFNGYVGHYAQQYQQTVDDEGNAVLQTPKHKIGIQFDSTSDQSGILTLRRRDGKRHEIGEIIGTIDFQVLPSGVVYLAGGKIEQNYQGNGYYNLLVSEFMERMNALGFNAQTGREMGISSAGMIKSYVSDDYKRPMAAWQRTVRSARTRAGLTDDGRLPVEAYYGDESLGGTDTTQKAVLDANLRYSAGKGITPSMDAEYLRLAQKVMDGTATVAERDRAYDLINTAAKNAGFGFDKWYHGTPEGEFNSFDFNRVNFHHTSYGGEAAGLWVSQSRELAKGYLEKGMGAIMEYYKKNPDSKNSVFDLNESATVGRYDAASKSGWKGYSEADKQQLISQYNSIPRVSVNKYRKLSKLADAYLASDEAKKRNEELENTYGTKQQNRLGIYYMDTEVLRQLTVKAGFTQTDGGKSYMGPPEGTRVAIDHTGTQLKNPSITVDDSGNIIPLSQRFDVTKADTRFSAGKGIGVTHNFRGADVKNRTHHDLASDFLGNQYAEMKRAGTLPPLSDKASVRWQVRPSFNENGEQNGYNFNLMIRDVINGGKVGNFDLEVPTDSFAGVRDNIGLEGDLEFMVGPEPNYQSGNRSRLLKPNHYILARITGSFFPFEHPDLGEVYGAAIKKGVVAAPFRGYNLYNIALSELMQRANILDAMVLGMPKNDKLGRDVSAFKRVVEDALGKRNPYKQRFFNDPDTGDIVNAPLHSAYRYQAGKGVDISKAIDRNAERGMDDTMQFSAGKGSKLVDGLWSGVLKELERRDRKGLGTNQRDASIEATKQFRELAYDDADGNRRAVLWIEWGSAFGPTGKGSVSQVWTIPTSGLTEQKLLQASSFIRNGQSGLAEAMGATKQPINLQEAAKFFKNADYWTEGEESKVAKTRQPSGLTASTIVENKAGIADELSTIEGIEISKTDLEILFGKKGNGGLVKDISDAIEVGDLEAYETAIDEMETLKDELEQKQENTPEGLQDTDAYNNRAEAIDAISELIDYLRDPQGK